jgi:hypothetical protein
MDGLTILAFISCWICGVYTGTLYERNRGVRATTNTLTILFFGSLLIAITLVLCAMMRAAGR